MAGGEPGFPLSVREVTDQQKEEARMSFVVLDENGRISMHSC